MKVIGVEPADANAMALSLHHGQRVLLQQVGGFADGVAVKVVGEETFRLCQELLDGVVLVNRDAICAAIKVLHCCTIRFFVLPRLFCLHMFADHGSFSFSLILEILQVFCDSGHPDNVFTMYDVGHV